MNGIKESLNHIVHALSFNQDPPQSPRQTHQRPYQSNQPHEPGYGGTYKPQPARKTLELAKQPKSAYFDNPNEISEATKLVLVGNPGVGKSSILNAFGADFQSGYSKISGLTRDVSSVEVTIDGNPFILYDIPGIDDSVTEDGKDSIVRHLTMLQDILNSGGKLIILFVIKPINGRINPSDFFIMKTVIDSFRKVPPIGMILTHSRKHDIEKYKDPNYTLYILDNLEKLVEPKWVQFLPKRYPLVLVDHGSQGFSSEDVRELSDYILSFTPGSVVSQNMVEQSVRGFHKVLSLVK
ncbi:hypothetical protein FBU30_004358 [Linnemannia zychae]|nr:hypothetical protein FBU30_004358 [Linnemannia zychae]